MSLAGAARDMGHQVNILSHDNLPRMCRGRLALICFPVLVAWKTFIGREHFAIIDFTSYDGWIAAFLPAYIRPALIFRSHGLEHIVHRSLVQRTEQDIEKVSWKYRLYRGSVHLRLIAHAARRADLAFFLNRFEQNFAVEELGLDRGRTALSTNALADDLLSKIRQDTDNLDVTGSLNIVFVGTYIERKGIAYLMPAVIDYLSRHTDARLLMAGTGAARDLINQSLPVEIRSRVTVVERYERQELPGLLAESQVLVLPSIVEGFGMAALEAMACGVVPIVTRGQGFEEFVVDGENGLLVDSRDTRQIISALDRLNGDRAEWMDMRSASIRTSKSFTWQWAASVQLNGYTTAILRRSVESRG